MKSLATWLALALLAFFPQDALSVELRYTIDDLHTTYWWRESCDASGCQLESGGPVEATLQIPSGLVAIHSLRYFVAGRSFTGCWVCVECCEGSAREKKCHEDPPFYTTIAFRLDEPCGRHDVAAVHPTGDDYWVLDEAMVPRPDPDCPGGLDPLIGQEIAITVSSDPTNSSPCGYWNPDPSHEIVRFDVVLDVEYVVDATTSSWSLVKALYD